MYYNVPDKWTIMSIYDTWGKFLANITWEASYTFVIIDFVKNLLVPTSEGNSIACRRPIIIVCAVVFVFLVQIIDPGSHYFNSLLRIQCMRTSVTEIVEPMTHMVNTRICIGVVVDADPTFAEKPGTIRRRRFQSNFQFVNRTIATSRVFPTISIVV